MCLGFEGCEGCFLCVPEKQGAGEPMSLRAQISAVFLGAITLVALLFWWLVPHTPEEKCRAHALGAAHPQETFEFCMGVRR